VQDGPVANGHMPTDGARKPRISMQAAQILNVGALANPDRFHITA
jgi:hypothetical protein